LIHTAAVQGDDTVEDMREKTAKYFDGKYASNFDGLLVDF
jgi:hypothetical protein